MRRLALVLSFGLSMAGGAPAFAETTAPMAVETPVVIGQSYALPSAGMNQTREINVWLPPGYAQSNQTYPVLYVLDGGQDQDFHHISGIAQLGTIVGTTRDVIVVGIASMDRRNELALPTDDAELIARYPTQGQSDRFRRFIAEEAMPFIEVRYRTSGETALMGESLAGLFVVETFLKESQLFDAYVAVSPSLWWDGGRLARQAGAHLRDHSGAPRTLILTLGDEGEMMQAPMDVLTANLRQYALPNEHWSFTPRPTETHATIYHGAALDAFRQLYAVDPQ